MTTGIGSDMEILSLTPDNIGDYGVCGYKDAKKHVELHKKIQWFEKYYPLGLRIKIVLSPTGGYQGMIEYIPGKHAHRPVDAQGYMFIHCVFVGFKKEFKGRGFASALIEECISDAKTGGMSGVAVVTRKGPFMVDKDIFLKQNFEVIDSAPPDFDLLVKKYDANAPSPRFKADMAKPLEKYGEGLTVLRSVQCPYTEKNVNAILETTEKEFKLKAHLVDLNDAEAAQDCPCAFGAFCIVHEGEIISHHPISNKRFENIMKKRLGM